jgi:putative transposase
VQRQLSQLERDAVLALLHNDRFADLAVPQVFAQLLDEGIYLCSESTMYRLLRANAEVKERRLLAQHPEYRKPELLATGPRQVFSWDITKIRGPQKGVWFSLLVMIDIFSRFVVGWSLVRRSNAKVAAHFVSEIVEREGIEPGQVTIHNDRGTEMTAETFCSHLDALGVTRSLSRPQVSDDTIKAYAGARTGAARETRLPLATFPGSIPPDFQSVALALADVTTDDALDALIRRINDV